ncbi:hypothetical protein GCM10010124_37270 [Pilimelia terevasa]|uniref:Uncharacterized protein n=1 Tax=Pilimelia terevasa TaxID=53372 RepID=A0A8J3BUZ9_9ACTN|nr:hypothetical protein [Pilimelia terevasa]GGK40983.1 hypothetical protein GCM10010124_37270 [Pilimelia terevasa]
MTAVAAPAVPAPPAATAPPARRVGPGWLPALLVGAATVACLRWYGVGLGPQARFAGYLAAVVLLPGTLLWRALRGRAGALPADAVGGAALGYAVEVGLYVAGRAAGWPYLPVAGAAAVLAAFAAAPRLRRWWRGSGAPVDARWAWAVAGLVALITAWCALTYFRVHGLDWPASGTPSADLAYHHALVAELRHHLPGQIPYVTGVPLRYHWFAHADWAAATWGSGVDATLVTYRLGTLPAAVLGVVGIAVLGGRVVPGRWWAGPLVALCALFAVTPDPAPWSRALTPSANIPYTMWLSPTQTFAALLFLGLVLVLGDLLDRRGGPGAWVAFGLLLAAVAGAKASFVPLLLAGLLLVVAATRLRRAGWCPPAAAAAGLTALALAGAQYALYRGTSAGLMVDPLAAVRVMLPARAGWPVWLGLAVWALCWAAVPAAALVLLCRRAWADPLRVLCAGIGAAALLVVLVTYQMGGSQQYFLQAARPYLAALVVAGLAAALPAAGVRRPWARALLWGALGLGAAVTAAAALGGPPRWPTAAGGWLAPRALWPYAVPPLAAAAAGLAAAAHRRTRPWAAALALLTLVGAAVPGSLAELRRMAPADGRYRDAVAAQPGRAAPGPPAVPDGAAAVGRWLRRHTGTDTLLATNSHCRFPVADRAACDGRQFWVAALAERRVLLEGWAYTPPANAVAARDRLQSNEVPYWDPALMAVNDAAFAAPSAATLGALRDRYGVRWLVVDRRHPVDLPALDRVAPRRLAAGDCAVYEVGPATP